MILESKKLFLKKIFIIFEDAKLLGFFKNKKYSSVVAISRNSFPELAQHKRAKTTAVIDLQREEKEIFSKFSDTTRNEIRRTDKIPELKIISEDSNRATVYKMYKEFEYAQRRVPFPSANMKNCIIFSAYLSGELISGIYLDKGEDKLRLRYVFSKRLKTEGHEMRKMISFASRRLIWQIILWGKRSGFSSLDMATINLTDKEKEGITKFKMSFGGELAEEYTYIRKSQLFPWFEKAAIIKNFIKKIFKI